MTEKQARKFVAMIMAAFPRPQMPASTRELYTRFLMAMDHEAGAMGVGIAIAEAEYLPTVAEIRKAASTARSDVPSSADAWRMVCDAIRRNGRDRLPQFDVDAVADTVYAMGWVDLCNSTNPIADRAHFLRLYAERVERDERASARASLVGVGAPRQLKGAADGV